MLNIPGLTLRLVMLDFSEWATNCYGRGGITKAEGDAILAAYKRILAPLLRYHDLKRFHTDSAFPWN